MDPDSGNQKLKFRVAEVVGHSATCANSAPTTALDRKVVRVHMLAEKKLPQKSRVRLPSDGSKPVPRAAMVGWIEEKQLLSASLKDVQAQMQTDVRFQGQVIHPHTVRRAIADAKQGGIKRDKAKAWDTMHHFAEQVWYSSGNTMLTVCLPQRPFI